MESKVVIDSKFYCESCEEAIYDPCYICGKEFDLDDLIECVPDDKHRHRDCKPISVEKIEPYTEEWEREADGVARCAIDIIPCADCGRPVIDGYCCDTCGSENPGRNER